LSQSAEVAGQAIDLSVVIPTYRRGEMVLTSARELLALHPAPAELLLVDQSESHPPEVQASLEALAGDARVRWLRLPAPSIPKAMNVGLCEARGRAVLFLDDDIHPHADLVQAHARAQQQPGLVAGQVLQPGQEPRTQPAGEPHRFDSDAPARIREFMGGNFSVDRAQALALGGFDENFVGAAYRFEAEFAARYVAKYGAIRFDPSASIRHLAIPTGGTRAHGHHLRTAQPAHSAGAYYYLLRIRPDGWRRQALVRPLRAVRTRHHLRHPWWIPMTLVAELRGWLHARRLFRAGPKLIDDGGRP
jgi:glycosyltransferase involved in cell wall biosynthesis